MILKNNKKGKCMYVIYLLLVFFWEYMFGIEENIIIRIFFDGF